MRKVSRVPYLISGMILPFCYGILFTWSLYRGTLLEMYPNLTAGDLSIIYAIHNIAVGSLNFCYGFLRKRLQPKTIMRMGGICISGGLYMMSFLPTAPGSDRLAFWMMLLFFGIIAASGVGMCQSTCLTTYPRWFPEKRGMMNGLSMSMFYLCSFLLGSVVVMIEGVAGFLPTFKILGIGLFVTFLIASHWTEIPGPDIILPAFHKQEENRDDRSYTIKEALTSPVFWIFFIYGCCIRTCSLTVNDHAASIAVAFGLSGILGLIDAPFKAGFAVVAGSILNKLGVSRVLTIAAGVLLFSSCVLIISFVTGFTAGVLISMVLIGISFGSTNGISATILRILFGEKNYNMIYSLNAPATLVAGAMGILAGKLLDLFGNSYLSVFILLAVVALICNVCVYLLKRAIRQRTAMQEKNENKAAAA